MGSVKFYKAWTLYHTTIWGLKQKLSIRTFRLHWAQKDVKTHHMEKKKKTLLVDVHHYIQYKQSQFGSKRCTRHHLQRKLTVRGESQSMRVRWQWLGKGLLQAFSAGSRDLRPLLWDRGWSGLWAAQSQLFRSNRSDQEKKKMGWSSFQYLTNQKASTRPVVKRVVRCQNFYKCLGDSRWSWSKKC